MNNYKNYKLTDKQKSEIRKLRSDGASLAMLASKFGVGRSTIQRYANYEHSLTLERKYRKQKPTKRRKKLWNNKRKEIRKKLKIMLLIKTAKERGLYTYED